MSSSKNKTQLIKLISEHVCSRVAGEKFARTLILTEINDTPIQVKDGVVSEKSDMSTTHEEADIIMVQQAIRLMSSGKSVRVISDDTDVFTLLAFYYSSESCNQTLLMEGTRSQRKVIDIRETVKTHEEVIPNLLELHALTGCDTVSRLYGIGKKRH